MEVTMKNYYMRYAKNQIANPKPVFGKVILMEYTWVRNK